MRGMAALQMETSVCARGKTPRTGERREGAKGRPHRVGGRREDGAGVGIRTAVVLSIIITSTYEVADMWQSF